jgi:hypothetical protein
MRDLNRYAWQKPDNYVLLAEADQPWLHPSGAFALEALSPGRRRRQRVNR